MNDEFNSSGIQYPAEFMNPLIGNPQDDHETISAGSSSDKDKTNQCRVCDRAAGKHLCYGARVCQCCRAFFRRSVTRANRKNFAYACSCEERCDETKKLGCRIHPDTKRNCKYCRYLKCLQACMAKKMVRIEKRNRNLKNKKKASNSAANKDAKCRNEDVDLKQLKAIRCSEDCTTELSTPTIIIDISQKYSETPLFLSDKKFKDILSSYDTKDTLVLATMCLKLENALNKQVYLIAMEFQEFFQLEQSLKAGVFEENTDTLINLCKIELILNCSKVDFTDTSKTQFFNLLLQKIGALQRSN